jgi:hypothetical protein
MHLFFRESGKRKEWKNLPVATNCHGHKTQALNRLTTRGAETARRAKRDMQAACQRGRRASDYEGRNLKSVSFPGTTRLSGPLAPRRTPPIPPQLAGRFAPVSDRLLWRSAPVSDKLPGRFAPVAGGCRLGAQLAMQGGCAPPLPAVFGSHHFPRIMCRHQGSSARLRGAPALSAQGGVPPPEVARTEGGDRVWNSTCPR